MIDALHAVAPPFPLPGPAVAAALATLDAPQDVAARVTRNATERRRMEEGLRGLGLPVARSQSNFIWLPVGEVAVALAAHFHSAGIAVRCFAGEGVRISTGMPADTDAILAAAAAWRPAHERT